MPAGGACDGETSGCIDYGQARDWGRCSKQQEPTCATLQGECTDSDDYCRTCTSSDDCLPSFYCDTDLDNHCYAQTEPGRSCIYNEHIAPE